MGKTYILLIYKLILILDIYISIRNVSTQKIKYLLVRTFSYYQKTNIIYPSFIICTLSVPYESILLLYLRRFKLDHYLNRIRQNSS